MSFGDAMADAVVVEQHVLLEDRLLQGFRVMHSLDIAAAIQLGQLGGVERVILLPLLGDQSIASRLAHHHLLHVLAHIPPQPVRHGSFLDHLKWTPFFGPRSDQIR